MMTPATKFRKYPKKSTLVLLSIGLTLLTLYTAYILIVNQKLGANDFRYANNDKTQYAQIKLNKAKVIVVKGLQRGTILTSDSIRLEVWIDEINSVHATVVNDTLRIAFNGTMKSEAFLYLPTGTELVADSSALEMRGSLNYNAQPEYSLTLRSSSLMASGRDNHAFMEKLSVRASGDSRVRIARHFHINQLELVNVHDATFAQGWQIGKLTSAFDDGRHVVVGKYVDSVAIRPH